MRKDIEGTGFSAPPDHLLGRERRSVAVAALVATTGLALAIIIAVTAVSVGIARANVIGNVIDNEGSLFAIALMLGLLFIGMGGLTVLTMPGSDKPKHPEHADHTPHRPNIA